MDLRIPFVLVNVDSSLKVPLKCDLSSSSGVREWPTFQLTIYELKISY